jgi:uncharacterized protein YaeQ
MQGFAAAHIHRAGALEVYGLDRGLIAAFAARLERRMTFTLTISDCELYLSIGADTVSGKVSRAPAL